MSGIGNSLDRGWHFTRKAFEEGISFGKHNIFDVAAYLIVAAIVAIVGIIAAVILGVGISVVLTDSVGLLGAGAVGSVVALIILIGTITYTFGAQFGAIEFIYGKKRVPYFEGKNVSVGFRWTIFVFAVTLILIALMALLAMGMGSIPIISLFAFLLLMFLLMFLAIFICIAMYYVSQELAVKKKGPWEAVMGSYDLVKNNFWETLLFGIILWVAAYALTMLPALVFYGVMWFGILMSMISPVCLGIVVVALLLYILAMLLIEALVLIIHVGFYRELVTAPKKAVQAKAKAGKTTTKKKKPVAKKKKAA